MTDSPFNVVLAEARIESGLTPKEAAARTGFTVNFVRSYEEYAKNPTMQTMCRFAKAYGLSVTITPRGVSIESAQGAVLLQDWDPDRPEPDISDFLEMNAF